MASEEWDVRDAEEVRPRVRCERGADRPGDGKPVAQVAWDLGIHEGPTLGNGVNEDRIDQGDKEGVVPRPTRGGAKPES